MPTIDDIDVDFDAMSNEDLEAYLAELREVSAKRKPRAGASIKLTKNSSISKAPKRNIIKVEL